MVGMLGKGNTGFFERMKRELLLFFWGGVHVSRKPSESRDG